MYLIIKSLIDFTVSLIIIILLFPVLLLIGVIIYIKIGSPIIFKQERPGLNGTPFTFYKFRTMKDDFDEEGNLLPDLKRLTNLGSLLRKTSLDELPSFFNVLKGEMSIVGPRPLLMEYLTRYSKEQFRRHKIKPGITGWAQINGRNEISWQKKFELDLWYIDNISLFIDIKIVILTLFTVLRKKGINQSESVTMEKFKGNK